MLNKLDHKYYYNRF